MAIMTTAGLTVLATRAIANTPAAFTYGAWTETAITEAITDTALAGEIGGADGLARAAMTCSNPSAQVTQWTKVWTANSTKNARGFAIFNANAAGNMLMEHLLSCIKGAISGETLTATAQMTTAAA